MRKRISPEYVFHLPNDLKEVSYDGKILIISPNTAKWIVLNNYDQLSFLHLLRNEITLQQALEVFDGSKDDARVVVTQLVARQLEETNVQSCVNDETKQLHFYLTNKCNLRCPHCYMLSGEPTENELTTDEVIGVLKSFAKYGGKSVTLSGGEIALRPDLIVIIRSAHDLGLKIRLLTNGVIWDENLISEVSCLIDSVQVSVDGYSEESNQIVRGKGNFKKALNTISSFISHGVTTELGLTPTYYLSGKDDSSEYVEFCRELLDKYPKHLFKIKIAEEIIEGREVSPTEGQFRDYNKYIHKIKSALNGHSSELESFVRAFGKDVVMDNCMYGVFSVDSKGDVFFCARVSSLKPIGNIKNMPFSEIIRLSKVAQEKSKIDNFMPCKECELKYICGGGCRIDSFSEFANITDVENVDFSKISPRKCSQSDKERFYRLMIDANEKLFK